MMKSRIFLYLIFLVLIGITNPKLHALDENAKNFVEPFISLSLRHLLKGNSGWVTRLDPIRDEPSALVNIKTEKWQGLSSHSPVHFEKCEKKRRRSLSPVRAKNSGY